MKSKTRELPSVLEDSLKFQKHSLSQGVPETIEIAKVMSSQKSMQNSERNPGQREKVAVDKGQPSQKKNRCKKISKQLHEGINNTKHQKRKLSFQATTKPATAKSK